MMKNLIILLITLCFYQLSMAQSAASEDSELSLETEATAQTTEPMDAAVPKAKRSLLKVEKDPDYTVPLYFDQVDNGVLLPPLELDYDLTQNEGKTLRMGNIVLSDKTFYFALVPLVKGHPRMKQVLSASEARQYALIMRWPAYLMEGGTLEMISRTGVVLWSHEITKEKRQKWQAQLNQWKQGMGGDKAIKDQGIFASQYALLKLGRRDIPLWDQNQSFRFCLTTQSATGQSRICSQRYGTQNKGNRIIMGRIRPENPRARVILQGQDTELKQVLQVNEKEPTSFFAELLSGETYEFVSVPRRLQLADIAETNVSGTLRIVGVNSKPVGPHEMIRQEQYSKLTTWIGFEDTIRDQREFWAAPLKVNRPWIFINGQDGGIFRQRLELSVIPQENIRPYLHRRTPDGTYVDGIKLFGLKPADAQVASSENEAENDDEDSRYFTWWMGAKDRGQINKSYLELEQDGKKYRTYYEIYKGFPREISGRFTGILTTKEQIFMGEGAFNYWFEDIFGWANYWVSRQRWGISAKYFNSFNKLAVDTSGTTAALTVNTVDLKYRLTPGLWGRDESFGGMFSYQSVTFDKIKSPMMGFGGFWARSMPKVFDDIFNIVPMMRYPKWVDMEFIYYASSMKSDVRLDINYALNFHGKVLWTDRIFGEAGFGLKRYAFTDIVQNQKAALNTFYGTVGLGLNF